MLIEILTFFAVASGLATLACLVGRAAAWLWAGGAPAVMALLAASGEITALVNQDAVAGISLGIAGLLLLLEVLTLTRTPSYAFEMLDVLGRRGAPAPPPPVGRPPFVAIQVPCHDEPYEIVRMTLLALARLDYPSYLVQVVDNNTRDPNVWMPLERLC
ncbi:MAG TPA: hypothetical protein VEK76_06860, partial [Candidatus Binatia bacterium]|nr:hypothetical protein [Candidatus Binatia bacterium]